MSDIDSLRSSKTDIDNPEVLFVKQLSPKRWKTYMINVLQTMLGQRSNKKNLLKDLTTIISMIPEENFVQAALQMRPFKPEFIQQNTLKAQVTQSTIASSVAKVAKFKNDFTKKCQKVLKKQRITEKTLKDQFNKQYHPYRFIIKNFSRLLELKFKQLIQVKKLKVCEVQQQLRSDLEIFNEFMKNSSQPYKKLFKIGKDQNQSSSYSKLNKCIQTFVSQHSKINSTIHKIILFAVRHHHQKYLDEKIQNFAEPESYDIIQDFKIDGCYIRAINSLMEFSEGSNPRKSMEKLVDFRSNILKDINEYYIEKQGDTRELQLSAEVQIQIIRFIVAKLKGWACQIYAQLKFLQVIYGDEQIAFKYEEVSFMYTQLSLVFEILQVS